MWWIVLWFLAHSFHFTSSKSSLRLTQMLLIIKSSSFLFQRLRQWYYQTGYHIDICNISLSIERSSLWWYSLKLKTNFFWNTNNNFSWRIWMRLFDRTRVNFAIGNYVLYILWSKLTFIIYVSSSSRGSDGYVWLYLEIKLNV